MPETASARPVIAISAGDPAGIGAEITVKALSRPEMSGTCLPLVVGDRAVFEDAIRLCGSSLGLVCVDPSTALRPGFRPPSGSGVINLLDMGLLDPSGWEYGMVSAAAGNAAFRYIEKAVELAVKKAAAAIVTAPINKESINLAGHHYAGHTEILAALTGTKNYAMLLASDSSGGFPLRVIHVTTHVPLGEVPRLISRERVLAVIKLAADALRLLGIAFPRIAVAALNPHASENGLFGAEEKEKIIPAIEEARLRGLDVTGPLPPDTVFVKALAGVFDVVVAMYHDQGHIPLKLSGFAMDPASGNFTRMSGINCTLGLPLIRTSVDHGTAFDRAGKNCSNEQSMVEAIEAACSMAKNTAAAEVGRHEF